MLASKKLTLLPLVSATYFMVSGGAYGLEELVACGYPTAIAALVVTPFIWSFPAALMVGELAGAVPEEGGYYAWVRRAMGPFWGFQEAWLSLVASIFDMAVYPTLFTLYLGKLLPWMGPHASVAAGVLLVAGCAIWNLRGASGVGKGSLILAVGLLAPFAAFGALAFAHHGAAVAPAVWSGGAPPPPAPKPDAHALFAGVMVAIWNYMGWDNASTIAREVDRPERTYPLAMIITVALVALTYLLPVAGASAAGIDPSAWSTGSWVDAGREVGGRTLELGIICGGVICGIGMYSTLLLSYSRLPLALAEDGFLPAWLARTDPKTGTPVASVVVCSIAYAACLGIGFTRLVELDVLLYGASLVLEFVALVALRVREPDLPRPFRVPGGLAGAALLGVAPALLLVGALWEGRDEKLGPVPTLAVGALLALLGPLVYVWRRPRATAV
jgi:amino acid transporter